MKALLIAAAALFLLGCETLKPSRPVDNRLDLELQRVAQDARQALVALSETNNAIAAEVMNRSQREQYIINNTVTPPGLAKKVNFEWYGELDAGLQAVAKLGHYEYAVQGRNPAIPIVVKTRFNKPLIEHIRDMSAQAGKQANIVIIPDQKRIELTYADQY